MTQSELIDILATKMPERSKMDIERWTVMIFDYLRGRPSLRRVCLLIDARHGLKDSDIGVMKDLDTSAVSYQIVLTKCDKVKATALAQLLTDTQSRIAKHVAAHPVIVQTSSVKGAGIEFLRAELAMIADIR